MDLESEFLRGWSKVDCVCKSCQAGFSGYTKDDVVPPETCDACQRREEEEARRAEYEQRRFSNWMSVVPVRHRDCEFGVNARQRIRGKGADIMRAKAAAAAMQSLTLLGQAGSGKTSLAAALVRFLFDALPRTKRERRVVVWINTFQLLRARMQHSLGHGECAQVTAAMQADLLILDDLGQEPRNELSPVPDVLFEREERALPTIITTGIDAAAVGERYGGGVARRVFECSELIRLGTELSKAMAAE